MDVICPAHKQLSAPKSALHINSKHCLSLFQVADMYLSVGTFVEIMRAIQLQSNLSSAIPLGTSDSVNLWGGGVRTGQWVPTLRVWDMRFSMGYGRVWPIQVWPDRFNHICARLQ